MDLAARSPKWQNSGMDDDTEARVRRAHRVRLWAGCVVVVVGLVFAFGNPLWGRSNTPIEMILGLIMVAAGVLNIVLSALGLRRLRRR
jgi:uncharacterized membrane protein HdeD (DUF308 family)